MSAENTGNTAVTPNPEEAEEPVNGISHDLIKERIKANLESLNEQVLTVT